MQNSSFTFSIDALIHHALMFNVLFDDFITHVAAATAAKEATCLPKDGGFNID